MQEKIQTTVTPAPVKAEPTFDSIKAELAIAITKGDDTESIRLSKALLKFRTDIEKMEAEKLKAEAEAMAGDREKLSVAIWKTVSADPTLRAKLEAVKAKGFTYKLDRMDPDNPTREYKSVELTVPVIKTRTGGGGGGSTGQLKAQTGLARHELIEKYATDVEKAAIQAAFDGAETRKDSARYNAEKPVIKRVLADNPELIKR